MSSKKRLREVEELHAAQLKYQKTFHNLPPRFKNNLEWLNKKLEEDASGSPKTSKTPKILAHKIGSSRNVKEIVELLTARCDLKGFKKVEKYDRLITKLSSNEKKEFAEIVKGDKLQLSFLKLNQQYQNFTGKVNEKKRERDELVANLPKLFKILIYINLLD